MRKTVAAIALSAFAVAAFASPAADAARQEATEVVEQVHAEFATGDFEALKKKQLDCWKAGPSRKCAFRELAAQNLVLIDAAIHQRQLDPFYSPDAIRERCAEWLKTGIPSDVDRESYLGSMTMGVAGIVVSIVAPQAFTFMQYAKK